MAGLYYLQGRGRVRGVGVLAISWQWSRDCSAEMETLEGCLFDRMSIFTRTWHWRVRSVFFRSC